MTRGHIYSVYYSPSVEKRSKKRVVVNQGGCSRGFLLNMYKYSTQLDSYTLYRKVVSMKTNISNIIFYGILQSYVENVRSYAMKKI